MVVRVQPLLQFGKRLDAKGEYLLRHWLVLGFQVTDVAWIDIL